MASFVPADEYLFSFLLLSSSSVILLGSSTGRTFFKSPNNAKPCPLYAIQTKPHRVTSLFLAALTFCSVTIVDMTDDVSEKLIHLKRHALKKGKIGYDFIYDLTGIKDCNKTHIKYLGTVKTSKGIRYKILTVFFVFRTGNDMCKGASSIEIYDVDNKYIGQYGVGFPEDLPDKLTDNRLIYLTNSKNCNLRKTSSIDLGNGLPKSFIIHCSESGGDIYSFSSGD